MHSSNRICLAAAISAAARPKEHRPRAAQGQEEGRLPWHGYSQPGRGSGLDGDAAGPQASLAVDLDAPLSRFQIANHEILAPRWIGIDLFVGITRDLTHGPIGITGSIQGYPRSRHRKAVDGENQPRQRASEDHGQD